MIDAKYLCKIIGGLLLVILLLALVQHWDDQGARPAVLHAASA